MYKIEVSIANIKYLFREKKIKNMTKIVIKKTVKKPTFPVLILYAIELAESNNNKSLIGGIVFPFFP